MKVKLGEYNTISKNGGIIIVGELSHLKEMIGDRVTLLSEVRPIIPIGIDAIFTLQCGVCV